MHSLFGAVDTDKRYAEIRKFELRWTMQVFYGVQMKQWNDWDDQGSDILGNGSVWGDMRGKVKTRQIGFIRNDSGKDSKNVARKSSVVNKGRSKTDASRGKQVKR